MHFTSLDWESNSNIVKFLDGEYNFNNVRSDEGVSIIFDIKKFVVGKQKFEDLLILYPGMDQSRHNI